MYALSSFPSTTPLCSSTQLITIIIPYSLLRYLAPHNSPKSAWRRPKIKKWLIEYLAVVRLKERNADKEAAGTTVTREGLLNELKRPPYRWRLTHMLHFQWCARPFDDSFPNLAHHRPRVYLLGHQVQAKFVCQSIACALGHPFQRISSGGVLMKPKYALTEVSGPRLVQALCKTSTWRSLFWKVLFPFVITPLFLIAFQMTFSERHLHSCYSY